LLSSISKDRTLLEWKYKTKINVMKLIKERNLFSSIPDTDTIQNVLNAIYPSIFLTKNSAKYFLTIIGDIILKKNNNLVFLVSQALKDIIIKLDYISLFSIGNGSIENNFMTKYHESYTYDTCRLIKINDDFSKDYLIEMLNRQGLNLLCVAAHYSKRYVSSDHFVESNGDEELKNYTLFLKNSNQQKIVDDFCQTSICKTESIFKMEWKNMHFVWKQYLSNNKLPNIIYSNMLKNILKERYLYDETSDSFNGIISKFIPIHSDFIKFWENVMNCNIDHEGFDYELEIDEICSLFKLWCKQKTLLGEQLFTNGNISEENALKILQHFFSNLEITENKYISNVKCIMWDKNNDIEKSFQFIKQNIKSHSTLSSLISFDEIYNYYYKYCNENAMKFIVSKRYFEKYLYYKLLDFIVYEKFILPSWLE
jgi:hypothetical protein